MAIPRRLVDQVLERDNGFCLLAGPFCLGEATVADHRANRGSGGSRELNNPVCLVAACHLCNGWKETAHSLELIGLKERGLRVLKASTNAATVTRCEETPVQDLDGQWYWLLPDGTRQRFERDVTWTSES